MQLIKSFVSLLFFLNFELNVFFIIVELFSFCKYK